MITYTVSLVVDGIELSDTTLDRLFAVVPDAVSSDIAGLVTISAAVEAVSAHAAASQLIDLVRQALPTAAISRIDQDLVSIPDISERTGRGRESVRLLIEGKRGPGGFPPPIGIVGSGIRVWPWSLVTAWFADILDEDLGEHCIPPDLAALIDSELSRSGPVCDPVTVG